MRCFAKPLLTPTQLLTGVVSLQAAEVPSEILSYYKALMQTQHRTQLLTTVFPLSGEPPESAKD